MEGVKDDGLVRLGIRRYVLCESWSDLRQWASFHHVRADGFNATAGDALRGLIPGAVECRGDGELLAGLGNALAARVAAYDERAAAVARADPSDSDSDAGSADSTRAMAGSPPAGR